jgi:hypothetical protein
LSADGEAAGVWGPSKEAEENVIKGASRYVKELIDNGYARNEFREEASLPPDLDQDPAVSCR